MLHLPQSVQVTIGTNTSIFQEISQNIIATTVDGRDDRLVVTGYAPRVAQVDCGAVWLTLGCRSHLDSVPFGPGINDNGSGSSLNLAMALQLARDKIKPKNKVGPGFLSTGGALAPGPILACPPPPSPSFSAAQIRFMWFGAEELGLLGSEHYVSNLNRTDVSPCG